MELSNIQIIGYTAGLISFFNMFRYMWAIKVSGIKPSLTYWILAEIAMILIALSSYAIGDRTSLWIAVAYATTQIIIIAMAFKYGYVAFTKKDNLLFAIALLSVGLWWYTSNPLYALIINVGIDASGYIPLFSKILKDPASEDHIYWGIAAFACVLNMFAVSSFAFSSVLYPWYLGIINACVFIVLLRPYYLLYAKKISR